MDSFWEIAALLFAGIVAGSAATSAFYEFRRRRIEAPRVTITGDGKYRRSDQPIFVRASVADPFKTHWTIDSVHVSAPSASNLISEADFLHRDEWNNPVPKPLGWKGRMAIDHPQCDLFLHPQSPPEMELTWTLRSLSSKRDTIRFTIDVRISD